MDLMTAPTDCKVAYLQQDAEDLDSVRFYCGDSARIVDASAMDLRTADLIALACAIPGR